tara:strand:- start:309 stop:809 length:501 start_codon:yes stop_codon:yes gene_type:complete
MSVRELNFTDLQRPGCLESLIDLGSYVHRKSAYKHLKFDRETLREEINKAIMDDNSLVIVVERDGRLVGGLLAYLETPYFSKELQSSDQIVFIDPQYGNTLDGPRLISRYVKWAKSKNASHIYFCHSFGWADRDSQEANQKLGKYLMRHHGFKEMGILYRIEKEVN